MTIQINIQIVNKLFNIYHRKRESIMENVMEGLISLGLWMILGLILILRILL